MITEVTAQELNTENFISEKVKEIKDIVEDGTAINALSGGVDSSTVTMLGHRALGNNLKTVFIENGLMREQESKQVVGFFQKLGGCRVVPGVQHAKVVKVNLLDLLDVLLLAQ